MKNVLGTLKKHRNGYTYLSLLPFPPDVKDILPVGLTQKADQAQFYLGKLSGITHLLPAVDFFISSYITKDATSSSQIEGTKATMVDAFEYSASPIPNTQSDADDIIHYITALNYGLKRLRQDDFPFVLRFIRELHKELMQNARATHFSDPGEFRKSQNWIGGTTPNTATFVPPPPEELARALGDLEKFIHTQHFHPIIQAGLLHAQFETIHPFLDGNGRTGRLLITFYLIHQKLLEKPILFLSSYFKKHQKVYYQKLAGYHDGDIESWLDFFLDGIIETAQQAIDVSISVTALREKNLKTIATFGKSVAAVSTGILQHLYQNPIVPTNIIEQWTGYSRPGVIKIIDKLVQAKILELYRKGEGTKSSVYIHREYTDLFTEK